ncbi:MAG: hypothetical protein DRH30_00955 [Deltaproteobacteria bacterium]|nr:MAG: hypothetical protein DRH30_00955 [Deltaproteobacteria bacterium]
MGKFFNLRGYYTGDGGGTPFTPFDLDGFYDGFIALESQCITQGSAKFLSAISSYLDGGQVGVTAVNDFTICGWITVDDLTLTNYVYTKWEPGLDFILSVETAGRMNFAIRNGGGTQIRRSNNLTVSPGVPVFWCIRNTAAARLMEIRNNEDAFLGTVYANPADGGAAELLIGASHQGSLGSNANQQRVASWNRVLSDAEVEEYYNGNAGLTYENLPVGLLTGLVSYWGLSERSGVRADQHGTMDLTAINAPGVVQGHIKSQCVDNSPVTTWVGVSGRSAVQAAIASQPTYIASGLNGEPVVRFDGTQWLATVLLAPALAQPLTMHVVHGPTVADASERNSACGGAGRSRIGTENSAYAGRATALVSGGAQSLVAVRQQFVFNGASSELIVDGVSLAVGNAGGQGMVYAVVGSGSHSGVTAAWVGDVPFVAFQHAVATPDELASMDAWMKARYSL